jgi:polyhydroxyalkanoate synthesis regulator phasin
MDKEKIEKWKEAHRRGKLSKEELIDLLKGEMNLEEIKKLVNDL